MAGKSKRVTVQLEDSATRKVRTLKLTLPTLVSDCPRTNPVRQSVVIIRRVPSWKKLTKVRVKVI
jgi:hypothetical protein